MVSPIHQRIRERREAFGVSVEVMAERAKMTSEQWAEIEAGGSFNVADLRQIGMALAVETGALLRGEESDPQRIAARFRQEVPAGAGRRLEAITLAQAAKLGRIGGGLLNKLARKIPLAEARQAVPVSAKEEPWQQGYRLGELARRKLGVKPGPIRNLQLMLEKEGVHVATLGFSEETVDAASLAAPGAIPVILLNSESPRVSQRLPRRTALAHELCHLLHDAGEGELETRMTRQEEGSLDDMVEQRARAFAPAFLAPRDEVVSYFERGAGKAILDPERKVTVLARRWGLSWRGAAWHAKNCRLISAENAEMFASKYFVGPRQDWQTDFEIEIFQEDLPESIEMGPLYRGRFAALVYEAFEEGLISENRAKEILVWG